MMSVERRKVLDLLAAGKITPEDAEQLLNRLSSSAAPEGLSTDQVLGVGEAAEGSKRRRAPRFLRVVVESPRHEGVNIRLPLGLVRAGLKLPTILPGKVARRLSERGFDLSHLGKLDDEALVAELASLQVDVEGENGETVRVFAE